MKQTYADDLALTKKYGGYLKMTWLELYKQSAYAFDFFINSFIVRLLNILN